jgi:hypothetical protein
MDDKCVAPGEPGQALWQISAARHYSSINQHGYDTDIPLERCLDLETNPIVRIVESSSPAAVSGSRPVSPNDRKQNVTPRYSLSDCFSEVNADSHRVNVHEDAISAEMLTETVIQTTGLGGRLFPSVANEDAATTRKRTHHYSLTDTLQEGCKNGRAQTQRDSNRHLIPYLSMYRGGRTAR